MAKNQRPTMYNLGSIYTGSNSTNPGVMKAQADKKKADANLASYKKKAVAKVAVAKQSMKKK